MSLSNLADLYALSDDVDRREGALAYTRYHGLLSKMSIRYGFPLSRVCAVFAATSPNNDYVGNLRSTLTILDAFREGKSFDDVQISTYRHCGLRAWSYLDGSVDFLATAKGLKIRNFYQNILDPKDPTFVTIDGHMVGAWRDHHGTMKELIVRPLEYLRIAADVCDLAGLYGLIPNQMQATLWFTRKRILDRLYDAQLSIFHAFDDQWRTVVDLDDIKPFEERKRV